MRRALLSCILASCTGDSGSSPTVAVTPTFATPEGALLCLEDAYRAKDMEAAVRAKDFWIEAKLMLLEHPKMPADQVDDSMIKSTAEALEHSYRRHIQSDGFPDMRGVKSSFPKVEPHSPGVVVVTEVCEYSDGGTSTQRILVAKTEAGWRVLNVAD